MIKNAGLEEIVSGLSSYVEEVLCEFYANLPSKKSQKSAEGVKVYVREHVYEFSPKSINCFLKLQNLSHGEVKADADADLVS